MPPREKPHTDEHAVPPRKKPHPYEHGVPPSLEYRLQAVWFVVPPSGGTGPVREDRLKAVLRTRGARTRVHATGSRQRAEAIRSGGASFSGESSNGSRSSGVRVQVRRRTLSTVLVHNRAAASGSFSPAARKRRKIGRLSPSVLKETAMTRRPPSLALGLLSLVVPVHTADWQPGPTRSSSPSSPSERITIPAVDLDGGPAAVEHAYGRSCYCR